MPFLLLWRLAEDLELRLALGSRWLVGVETRTEHTAGSADAQSGVRGKEEENEFVEEAEGVVEGDLDDAVRSFGSTRSRAA